MNRVVNRSLTPRSNIGRAECKAMKQLKRNKSRIVLTANKGMAMVVMDKQDYMEKAKNLLEHPTYRSFPADPTSKHKA